MSLWKVIDAGLASHGPNEARVFGLWEVHIVEEIRLSRPAVAAAAYAQEVDLLHHIVDLRWANREIHERVDQIDVEATFQRLRQRAQEASNVWEYAEALREELWTLGDGHLRLGPTYRRVERAFTSGLTFVHVLEGVAFAWADATRLVEVPIHPEPGDLLVVIDGYPAEKYLESVRLQPGSTPAHRRWNAILSLSWQERFPHERPSPTQLTLQKEDGQRYSLPVRWVSSSRCDPTPDCVRGTMVEEGIGYLEIRTFYCRDELGQVSDTEFKRQVVRAVPDLVGADHLIVDLRRNTGGRDEQAQIAASLFTREPMEWFRYWHHEPYGEAQQQLTPERTYMDPAVWSLRQLLSSRLWFLIGPGCFSTSEVFASAFRYRGNVTFIGEPSAGGAGNPLDFHLPYSGLTVEVPVSEFYIAGSDVTRTEAIGIVPDIPAVQTAADLRAGRDTVRERALLAIRKLGSLR